MSNTVLDILQGVFISLLSGQSPKEGTIITILKMKKLKLGEVK